MRVCCMTDVYTTWTLSTWIFKQESAASERESASGRCGRCSRNRDGQTERRIEGEAVLLCAGLLLLSFSSTSLWCWQRRSGLTPTVQAIINPPLQQPWESCCLCPLRTHTLYPCVWSILWRAQTRGIEFFTLCTCNLNRNGSKHVIFKRYF